MTFANRLSRSIAMIAAGAMLAGATGCASEHYRRGDGITDGLGDSVAHNTALQIVDPWQEGVEDTDIDAPYVRPKNADEQRDSTPRDVASPAPPAP